MAAYNPKNIKLGLVGGGGVMSGSGKFVGKTGPPASNPLTPEAETSSGLHIPLIRSKEAPKVLPTFTAALQRPADSLLAAEDLDNIQLELETQLSNVVLRFRVLKSEYDSLDRDERRNERRSKHTSDAKPASPAGTAANAKRRREDGNTTLRKNKTASTLKLTKNSKNSPATPNTDDSMDSYVAAPPNGANAHAQSRDNHHLPKMMLPKNDTPNKFWLSVEPYCMPVTNEDMRLVDDLLEQYSGPLVPAMPDLGPHYASVWAAEDLKEMQQASNSNASSHRQKQQTNGAAAMLKKADEKVEVVNGRLSQRLVAALVEDPMTSEHAASSGAIAAAESSNSSSENATSTTQTNFPSLTMLRSGFGIEKRIEKELIEQGILYPQDEFPHNDDDEIQSEIKRLSAELSTVATYNRSALKRLHNSSAQEIKRLEIKRKLDAVDQEILEAYKRSQQIKAKRRHLSAEEQQEIFRLTAEQKSLSDQLERAPSSSCSLFE